jgi:hypothetical protein
VGSDSLSDRVKERRDPQVHIRRDLEDRGRVGRHRDSRNGQAAEEDLHAVRKDLSAASGPERRAFPRPSRASRCTRENRRRRAGVR